MALRSAGPPPLPPSELQRMKDQLSTHYGSEVFEEAGAKVMIIRVPGDHPDPVNDIENAIEYLQPGDVAGLSHCLLMGNRQTQAVYTQPLQQLMSHRIERDRSESKKLRTMGEESFQVFRAEGDPRQLPRLGIRIPQDSVSELEEGDLEWLVDTLGPELERGRLNGIVAVHLVANNDDVRVDADAFLADVKRRFQDEDRKRARADELRRLADEAEAERRQERQKIVSEMETTLGRHVTAPLKRAESTSWQDRSWSDSQGERRTRNLNAEGAMGNSRGLGSSSGIGSYADRIDRLVSEPRGHGKITREPVREPREDSTYNLVRKALEISKFAIMDRPSVEGHTLDMAAERDEGYPQRVIVRCIERLSMEVAQQMLQTSRALDVDMALAVAPQVDPEAEKRLIATKVKWVRPLDIGHLHL